MRMTHPTAGPDDRIGDRTGGARPARRRGATIVEMAFVLPIFLMFTFGIFEYGRYLMLLHVTTNATRDAARYAVVRASFPEAQTFTVFPAARLPFEQPYSASRNMYNVPFIETYLRTRMAGLDSMITSFTVRVYPTDTTTIYSSPPVIQAKTGSTAWNSAAFSERVAVQVVGYYTPVTPNLLFLNGSLNFSTIALMGSEG